MLNSPLKIVLPIDDPRNRAIQERMASAAPSDVTNHGGPVLANVECTTVFLGDAWNQPPLSTLRDDFNTFLDDYLKSSEFANLSVYGIAGGSRVGTLTTSDALGPTVLDADLQAIVQRLTGPSGQILPNANTLVFLFTPQGTIVDATAIGAGRTCTEHCGYHNFVGSVPYAIMPYLDCGGCMASGMTTEQSMTSVMSHELCEAVTDPMLNGWYSPTGEEIGDLCAWQETTVDGFTAQKEWINGQGCL